MTERTLSPKSAGAYRTIGEAAEELKLPQHVLRFWETRFPQVKPLKRAGGRRFYRPEDVALLHAIKSLLYGQGYTIKGVQRMLQERGHRSVAEALAPSTAPVPAVSPAPPREPAPDAGGQVGGTARWEEDLSRAAAPPLRPVAAPSRPATVSPAPPRIARADDMVARLRAVAVDLAECGRLLVAARSIEG